MATKCAPCKGTGWVEYTNKRRKNKSRKICTDCGGHGEKK